jgi:small-conductance mechanosensitive channel
MVFLGHPVYGLSVVLFTILLASGIGSTTVGARPPRPGAVVVRIVALLATLAVTGLTTPLLTSFARSQATDMRILLSILLLAPPAFCMGMMFPLGLSIWRRHSELLPFFWSANGITSMFASVLGMALSIEFGIARTYALGVCFYVVCALMMVVGRRATRLGALAVVNELGLLPQDDAIRGAIAVAPSIQPEQIEWVAAAPRSDTLHDGGDAGLKQKA